MIGTIILFIAVLSLLVFVHEFGHFIMAKKSGMKVEEFGFGFPPRAYGIKRGETVYSINWIPLGGFVRIKGESGEFRNDPDSFAYQPIWKRFLVLVAGVTMNFILAAFLLSIGFMSGLPSIVDENISSQARLADEDIRVVTVMPDSPASEAGIVSGDKILSINGQVFTSAEEARKFISLNTDSEITLTVEREDDYVTAVVVTPAYMEEISGQGIGVGLVKTAMVSYPWHLAIAHGIATTGVYTWEVAKAFGSLMKSLIVQQEVSVDLSGPVGIAVLTGEVAAMGLVYLLQFTALLSINLAILNIFPFPALDGGRVLFLIIEKVRGHAVNQRIEGIVHSLGFAFLMIIVVLVTYRDLVRFGDQIIGTLKGLVGA